ncbi:hypothetical protein EDB89DRAFT_1917494 [Lactarius sanguifluus]|nr:hypothetical protein EDB89DRAFT_1917494 [Lactarius sanguifluus]
MEPGLAMLRCGGIGAGLCAAFRHGSGVEQGWRMRGQAVLLAMAVVRPCRVGVATGLVVLRRGLWVLRQGFRLPPCDDQMTGQATGKTTGLQDLVIATFQQPRQPPRPTAMTMATTTTMTTATTTGDYSDNDYIYGGYGHHSDDGYDDYGGRLQRRQHLWRLTNRRYSHHSHDGYDNYDDDYSNDYGNYGDDYGDTT